MRTDPDWKVIGGLFMIMLLAIPIALGFGVWVGALVDTFMFGWELLR